MCAGRAGPDGCQGARCPTWRCPGWHCPGCASGTAGTGGAQHLQDTPRAHPELCAWHGHPRDRGEAQHGAPSSGCPPAGPPSPTRTPERSRPRVPTVPQNPAGTHSARAAPRGRLLHVPPALRRGGRRKFLAARASSGAEQPGSRGPVPPPRSPPTHPLPPVSLTHRLRRAASRERARGSLEPWREGLPSLSLTSGSCSWMGPGHS